MRKDKEILPDQLLFKEGQLEEYLRTLDKAMVAFSGGVDSTYLLSKALEVIGRDRVLAVTTISVLQQPGAVEKAKALALELGACHHLFEVDLLGLKTITGNSPERCYYCKKAIFSKMRDFAAARDIENVLEGSNADDPGDYRPGLRALGELGITSPLLMFHLNKEEIRLLSRKAGLSTWNRPAETCLATRLAYGEEISEAKLKQVAEAELFIRQLGIKEDLRVRLHGKLARIEVNPVELNIIIKNRDSITFKLQELGFEHVTIDLDGFRSGSMNRTLFP